MRTPDTDQEIVAAGAVVARKGPRGPQVLLVHRPKYDDWSFPKGKLDPGEHALAAAVREIAEETGLDVRLEAPLSDQQYLVGNGTVRPKRVHYWVGRPVGHDDLSRYQRNAEIDELDWFDADDAAKQLTRDLDRATLEEFLAAPRRTTPLVVLRHAKARPRRSWTADDRERPLTDLGERQSDELVPMLAAYGVRRIVSSSSRRCWTSLAPYAHVTETDLEVTDALSEEDATADGVATVVADLMDSKRPAVLCTHRPVLPHVLAALELPPRRLETAGMLVVHHRGTEVVAVELHEAGLRS
ncbi:NUDIX hydrolase [Nocardioides mesophilus]|uniref:NUDIX hydrolase n=1 Tax=Nocardioides mesophilus TaxID=433659 RepID=A0A7G9REN4_9ACTN|nr:NUDIX hydrolase [Nocardioides mesophilus]QNN54059.1 NUDIX hydrolase [Nocardioides mesophilus]